MSALKPDTINKHDLGTSDLPWRNLYVDKVIAGSRAGGTSLEIGSSALWNGGAGTGSNLTVFGNLTVEGTTTTIESTTLVVEDPLIKLAKDNNGADALDIGFYGLYDNSGTDEYAGIFRDATDEKFKLFVDLQVEPTTTVNIAGAGYTPATLVVGTLEATTEVLPDADDGATLGSTTKGWSDLYLTETATINFLNAAANANDLTLTHSAGHLTVSASDKLCFGSTSAYINHDGTDLQLVDDADINIKPAVDFLVEAGGNIILDADGNSVTFKAGDDDTSGLSWTQSASGTWTHKVTTADADLIFNINDSDGGGDQELFRLDGSASSLLISADHKIEFRDNGIFAHSSADGEFTLSSDGASADAINIVTSNAAGGIDIDAGTGGIAIDSTGAFSIDGAAASNITVTSDTDAEDLTIKLAHEIITAGNFVNGDSYEILSTGNTDFTNAGAANSDVGTIFTANAAGEGTGTAARLTGLNSSLVLSSDGTGADALQLSTSRGGIDILNGGAANGEDIDITSTNASINLDAGEAVGAAIQLNASNAAGGVQILGGTGGFDLDVTAAGDGAGDGAITMNAAAASTIDVAAANLTLSTTTSGNVSISSAAIVDIDGANVKIDALDAGSIDIGVSADGTSDTSSINIGTSATARTITVGSDSSTKVDVNALAIELDSAGTVVVDAASTAVKALDVHSAGGIEITAAGADGKDIDISNTAGSVKITSGEAAADAITIDASAAGGGIDIIAGDAANDANSDINITASNALTIDAQGTDAGDGVAITLGTDTTNAQFKILNNSSSEKFKVDGSGAILASGALTVGANQSGHDVKFHGAGNLQHLLWDESANELALVGNGTKLSFFDAGGGESISADNAGILSVAAGAQLSLTSPTLAVTSTTAVTIATPSLKVESSTSTKPTFEIINTTDDQAGCELKLKSTQNGTAGVNDDVAGKITFFSNDDAGTPNNQAYGQIQVLAADVTSGSESGKMTLGVATTGSGAVADVLTITGGATAAASTVTIAGNLQVDGTTTTINSTTLQVDDKMIELAHSPNNAEGDDAAVDGGGIMLKSSEGDKEIKYVDADEAWQFSENLTLASGKAFNIITGDPASTTSVLNATTLGSTVVSSSLTSVGTIGTGTWNGSVIESQYLDADTAHLSGVQTFSGAKTFSAAAAFTNTVTVGANGNGHDVKFFGDAAGAYLEWDADTNKLELRGATAAGPGHLLISTGELSVDVASNDVLGKIDFSAPLESDDDDSRLVGASISAVAGAAFTATVNDTDLVFSVGKSAAAAEKMRLDSDGNLNVDGTLTCDTSLTIDTTTISAAEIGVLDGVTAGQVSNSKALVADGSGNIGTDAARLGTITSSGKFVTSDNTNASSTTDGSIATAGGLSVTQDVVIGQGLKLKSDANAVVSFGADSEITLSCVTDTGLNLKNTNTDDAGGVVLTLQTGDTDIDIGHVLGSIEFQAPDEVTDTDSREVAAAISAVAEVNFAADKNNTKLSFKTGASEAATEKMALSSAGVLTLSSGGIVIPNDGNIGSVGATDAIAISAGGVITIADDTQSSSKDTGALVVDGGVGIEKDVYINGTSSRIGTDSAHLSFDLGNGTTILKASELKIQDAGENDKIVLETNGDITCRNVETSQNMTIGNDADGSDRKLTFGHATIKSLIGIDDSRNVFAINTDASFETGSDLEIDVNGNVSLNNGDLTIGSDTDDGADRILTFGHAVNKTVIGIDDDQDVFAINTSSAFTAQNDLEIDGSGNVTLSLGDLSLSGSGKGITLTKAGVDSIDQGTTTTVATANQKSFQVTVRTDGALADNAGSVDFTVTNTSALSSSVILATCTSHAVEVYSHSVTNATNFKFAFINRSGGQIATDTDLVINFVII